MKPTSSASILLLLLAIWPMAPRWGETPVHPRVAQTFDQKAVSPPGIVFPIHPLTTEGNPPSPSAPRVQVIQLTHPALDDQPQPQTLSERSNRLRNEYRMLLLKGWNPQALEAVFRKSPRRRVHFHQLMAGDTLQRTDYLLQLEIVVAWLRIQPVPTLGYEMRGMEFYIRSMVSVLVRFGWNDDLLYQQLYLYKGFPELLQSVLVRKTPPNFAMVSDLAAILEGLAIWTLARFHQDILFEPQRDLPAAPLEFKRILSKAV